MPQYKVIEKGFLGGKMRLPGSLVTTDSPFKKIPKWLEPTGKGASSTKEDVEQTEGSTASGAGTPSFMGDEGGGSQTELSPQQKAARTRAENAKKAAEESKKNSPEVLG